MKSVKIISLFLFLLNIAGKSQRINSIEFNEDKVKTIFITPGLVSVIRPKCNIELSIVGNENDLKAVVSPTDKRTLIISAKSNFSGPTNLLIKCEKKRRFYVFDVIPSLNRHQDVVEGSMFTQTGSLIKSSHLKTKTRQYTNIKKDLKSVFVIKKAKLLKKGSL